MHVDLLNSAQSAHTASLLHQHAPLVHCMTNDVVQTFTANVLFAKLKHLADPGAREGAQASFLWCFAPNACLSCSSCSAVRLERTSLALVPSR